MYAYQSLNKESSLLLCTSGVDLDCSNSAMFLQNIYVCMLMQCKTMQLKPCTIRNDLFYMDTLFRKHDKFKSIFDSDDYKIEKFL